MLSERDKLIRQTREYLRQMRAAGIKERDLADRLGISWITIYRWRCGLNVPTSVLLLKLKTLAREVELPGL